MTGIILASVIVLIAVAAFFVLRLPQFGKPPQGDHKSSISQSPQFNGEKDQFTNAGGIEMNFTIDKVFKTLPGFLFPPKGKTPDSIVVQHPSPSAIGSLSKEEAALTWFGHSAFILEISGKVILLDPMFGPAAAPFSFQVRRFSQDLPIALNDLPEIDAIVFSHDHYDHLDYPTIKALKDKVGHFYVPLGLGSHLQHWGVAKDKITELDWWQNASLGDIEFICTPSQHFSGRGIGDGASTLWSSWVIRTPKRNIFFSGDSGYFPGFKQIGEQYGPFDLAMMECGQYNEMWKEIHMMPEESAQAAVDLRAQRMLPIHWGMFDLALHPWTDPIERVSQKAKALGMPLVTPQVGERFLLENPPSKAWWKDN